MIVLILRCAINKQESAGATIYGRKRNLNHSMEQLTQLSGCAVMSVLHPGRSRSNSSINL